MSDPIDPRRRHVLAIMSALGAGALVGCSADGEARVAGLNTMPVAGTVENARVSLPRHSIDVHTHFFNASDASVIGYFTHSVNHAHPKLQRFLVRMQGALEALISIAPSAHRELQKLRAGNDPSVSAAASASALQVEEEAQSDLIARELARELRRSGMAQEFGAGFETDNGFQAMPQDEGEIRALLDPDAEDVSPAAALRGPEVAGAFRFMGRLLHWRWTSLNAYQRRHGSRGISAAFGALVDFDYFYTPLAQSPLSEQVQLHSLLARKSGGFMLPLVAYNPWADIRSGGARLRLVTDAVERHGFIGAKIYPPVGYLPYGNARTVDTLDPKELDAALKRFFLECNRLGIPVMAHANSSQGRDFEADQNSRPDGWHNLIREMAKEGKVPLVNLGHFGGDGSKSPDGTINDWPQRFAQIMDEPSGSGFYGDLGYWTGLRQCDTGGDACDAARKRLTQALKDHPVLNDRLMYGSDWFMMIKEAGWKRWPDEIFRAMQGTGFDPTRLFHQNAMECFGLVRGGANRARLETFFNGNLPGWMA